MFRTLSIPRTTVFLCFLSGLIFQAAPESSPTEALDTSRVSLPPAEVDSMAMRAAVQRLEDSLRLGIDQLSRAWNEHEFFHTDSVRLSVQRSLGRGWRDWAIASAPRRGMTGAQWLRMAELLSWLERFDMENAFELELNAYKWAALYPEFEFLALSLLLERYRETAFAPGMLSTGERLLELDPERAVADGREKDMALACYFLGDWKSGKTWIRKHLEHHPEDAHARELKKKLRELKKRR